MFIKVCGLRTEADVATAAEAGADAVGFVFAASPRRVDEPTARRLVAAAPPSVLTVGVFKDMPPAEVAVLARATAVGAVQLHGDYPRSAFDELLEQGFRLIRATALTSATDVTTGAYGEDMLLLDSPVAGSGERWDLAALVGRPPTGDWLLAGGLSPDNVRAAVAEVAPWGLDVSSGVESSRGVKDHGRIRAFLAAARAA
ncbi:phosphoribosylanthranilate isomerase [Actinokineospora sp. PR83]|uniref:phosphoribosylanthranilate isomerase n=1 Tax=Actinokineospora sp. PR83 TaxID=2884908 RepID=UPI0027DF274A|nr:phosphoribosylanthranilate isomerase [Actinokineospora sp. PR83]MCG8919271.1 phosphoribosylanthranilate isomerase [Actinokineospora sp. PR83]